MSKIPTGASDGKLDLKSFYIRRNVAPDRDKDKDYVQVGIWNEGYEYLTLDHLLQLRKFLNETIMQMTFKTTTK